MAYILPHLPLINQQRVIHNLSDYIFPKVISLSLEGVSEDEKETKVEI